MKRIWLGILACILSIGITSAALAQKGDEPPPIPPAPKTKPKSKKFKRVIYAIELAASKKAKFTGNVTLRIASDHQGPDLTYYWGGKCKGTKVSATRLDMMMTAMKEGYSVEIPAFPIKYKDRIVMCMQSIRIIKE
jgi:hypothetical protein